MSHLTYTDLNSRSLALHFQLHERGETSRHISTFVISKWIVIFSSSMCFPWSMVGYFHCLCVCWQLSFIRVRVDEDQVDSETREHCWVSFPCKNSPRKLSGLRLVILDITDTFLILVLYSPSSSAIQIFVYFNTIFIKQKSFMSDFCLGNSVNLKGSLWHFEVECVHTLQQMLLFS